MTKSQIAELKAWKTRSVCDSLSFADMYAFNEILSRIEAEQGAVKDCGFTLATCPYERCSGVTMRKEAVEPLAVLADRKGIQKVEVYAPANEDPLWYIFWYDFENGIDIDQTPIKAPTYAAAEAKARQYLEGLEDKGGKV